jgi:Tfp pilus assembly protein PilF
LLGQKKYAEAAAQFRKSIETDPRYREAWQALADVLRAEGNAD